MKQMKKEVDALTKQLKALTQKVEKIVSKIDRPEKSQSKPKPAKKTAKSGGAATPKKAPKKPAAEKTPKKPAETKATGQLSDEVLTLIRSTAKGLNTDQIMEQTGLSKKQVWGIVSRAKKAGKINTGKRGIYTAS